MKLTFTKFRKKERSHVALHESSLADYTNPIREWTLGLSLACIALLLGASFVAFDFYTQFIATSKPVVIEQSAGGYNERDVLFYAEHYDKKEKAFNELRKASVVPVAEVVDITTPEVATTSKAEIPTENEAEEVEDPVLDQPIEIGV